MPNHDTPVLPFPCVLIPYFIFINHSAYFNVLESLWKSATITLAGNSKKSDDIQKREGIPNTYPEVGFSQISRSGQPLHFGGNDATRYIMAASSDIKIH